MSRAGSMSRRPTRKAKRDSEAGIMRNLAHFGSGHTSGYLGTVSQDVGATPRDYDALARDIILHGSPATVIAKIEELQAMAQATLRSCCISRRGTAPRRRSLRWNCSPAR